MNVGGSIVGNGPSMCVVYMKIRWRENKEEHSWNSAEEGLILVEGENNQNAHFTYLHMWWNAEGRI